MSLLAALAPVAVTLAAATPGVPCAPRAPLSAFEEDLQIAQGSRATFGLRSDRAWVLRVWRSPRSREHFALNGPASPWEIAYFDRRDRVSNAAGRAEAYMFRHLPGVYGGLSIEDDRRRGAYVRVYVVGETGDHEERLRRRFPVPDGVRFERVRFTEDDLDDVQSQVDADFDALDEEGFDVRSTSVSLEDNAVVVEMITRRTDAAAVFLARYGPAVKVEIIARAPARLVCTSADGYRPSATGRTLRVEWTTNSVYRLKRIAVRETAHSVRIGIVERAPNGPVTLAASTNHRRVRLARPLGGRRVIDMATGRPMRRLSR